MGMARAAELNHFPGPAHLLELREKLGLTPEHVSVIQASFERMSAAAKPLGAAWVEMERGLDQVFRDGTVTAKALERRTAEIAPVQGELRAVHLTAHLEMRQVLTPFQIAAYDKFRGYKEPTVAPEMHPGMHRE